MNIACREVNIAYREVNIVCREFNIACREVNLGRREVNKVYREVNFACRDACAHVLDACVHVIDACGSVADTSNLSEPLSIPMNRYTGQVIRLILLISLVQARAWRNRTTEAGASAEREATNLAEKDACLFFSDRDDLTEIPDTLKFIVTPELPVLIDLSTLPADKRFVYAANLSSEDEG